MASRMYIVLISLALQSYSASVFAWGATGHRVVGQIAETYLSSSARTALQGILGVEDLAEAATWADEMRSSAEPFWQEKAGAWHYVTVPDGQRYPRVEVPEAGDAYTALQQFARVLQDPAADLPARQLALRFAIHLVGDLHQPLHVGNGLDRGGNDIKVTWFGEPANLHRLWDTSLIEHQALSYSEMSHWLGRRITPAQADLWLDADPLVWIAESAAVRASIYPQQQALAYDYAHVHTPLVERRLSQAGVRLAAWLNRVFAQ